MAMEEFNEAVRNSRNIRARRYVEKSGDKVSAIADYTSEFGTSGNDLFIRYIEAAYSIPQFTKSQKLRLNNLCQKFDCFYKVDEIMESELLEKGITKRVTVAVSPVENNKAVVELNNFFGVTNFVESKKS